jgi:GxxExxY protein
MARMDADMGEEYLYPELSETIIGSAMAVMNELKPGLDEKIYERALVIELEERGLACSSQTQHQVFYKGRPVGVLIPDLVVESKIIVDTKVVSIFVDSHVAQMVGYLAITGLEVGLLINFKSAKLQWKRVARHKTRNPDLRSSASSAV